MTAHVTIVTLSAVWVLRWLSRARILFLTAAGRSSRRPDATSGPVGIETENLEHIKNPSHLLHPGSQVVESSGGLLPKRPLRLTTAQSTLL